MARLELVRAATAATEADLWFSALVTRRSPAGISLDPGVRRELRRDLVREPALLDRACLIIAGVHANEVPVVLAEERLVALGLLAEAEEHRLEPAGFPVLGLGNGTDAGSLIEEELRALAVAMRQATGSGFARWVARALPALPPAARRTPTAWTLALGASMRLGGRRVLQGAPPKEVTPEAVAWLLPQDGPRTEVGVRLLTGALEFSTGISPDAQVVELPRTDPLILNVSYPDGQKVRTRRILLPASGVVTVPVNSDGLVVITTAFGQRYTIEPERSARSGPQIYIAGTSRSGRRLEELVTRGVREAGVDIITSDSEMVPGEEWQAARYQSLSSCDAAVIIVTRDALVSQWTLRDVTILMWRKTLQPDFLVLPIKDHDLTFGDISSSPLGETGLNEVEFLVEEEPLQTVGRVSQVLRQFASGWREAAPPAPAPTSATSAAPAWALDLDCPKVIAAGSAFTVTVGVTPERRKDRPVLTGPEELEIRVSFVEGGRVRQRQRTERSVTSLAKDAWQISFTAPADPGQNVHVRATFLSQGVQLATMDQYIPVIEMASADRPPEYRDAADERRLVVLGRRALKEAIRQLADPTGALRILVVNGPPGSGKSFTTQIIEQAAREARTFQTVYVDLALFLTPGPVDLARELVSRMGRSPESMPQGSDSTAPNLRDLVNWLIKQSSTANGDWWWVLDSLSSPTVPQETQDLIVAIAASVQRTSLRLVLLDFNKSLPANLSPLVFREELTPIGEPEVREFFSDLLRQQGIRPESVDIDALTRSALEDLPADASRLGALSARVSQFATRLMPS
jgi:hypothetical protein